MYNKIHYYSFIFTRKRFSHEFFRKQKRKQLHQLRYKIQALVSRETIINEAKKSYKQLKYNFNSIFVQKEQKFAVDDIAKTCTCSNKYDIKFDKI